MCIRIVTESDFPQLVTLYQNCFAEPPWFEAFDTTELLADFKEILSWPDAIFLACEIDGRIVGGATGFSVARKRDILECISYEYITGFYFADIFVNASLRNGGIGKKLVEARLQHARKLGFTHGIVRTSVQQPIVQHLYIDEFGYKIVATQETLSTKVVNGVTQVAPDTRVIMVGTFR
jgi:GNAT superfamily N-acetyltransferase